MKKALLIIMLLHCFAMAYTQEICNVNMDNGDFLSDASEADKTISGPFTVRIFVHILRQPNCDGGITQAEMTSALQILEDDFHSHNICFSLLGQDEICTSLYYTSVPDVFNHFNINSNFAPYKHPNAIDIFLCPNSISSPGGVAHGVDPTNPNSPPCDFLVVGGTYLAGNCNGNIPSQGVVAQTHVMSHEMGHCLGLYHTHEGNIGFCSNAGCLEHDGVNGATCGDYVIDTHSDPCSSFGYYDPTTCVYTGIANDPYFLPQIVLYNPDMHNFMSYICNNCKDHFTFGQGQRMRSFLATHWGLKPRVVPHDVFVQDQIFNTGVALYAANTSVTAGKMVTSPPYGWAVVNNTGKLEFKSNSYLSLEPGFIAEPAIGGNFYAHIDPYFCNITDQNNSARTSMIEYYPLLDKPKWYYVMPTPFEGTQVRKIEDIGDTILNGTNYTIINISAISFPGLQNTYPFFYDTGNFYLREDIPSKKIYQRSAIGGPDSLLYDFSLNIGDSMQGASWLTLVTIDSVLFSTGYHKRFIFTYSTDSVIWIEGVGNINYVLGSNGWFAYPGWRTICSYQNDTLLYDAGSLYNFSCTTLTTALNEQHQASLDPLNIYPNPFDNSFTTVINLDKETVIDMVVYDAIGKAVEVLAKNKICNAGKHEIKSEKKLPAGVYLVKLTAGDKNYMHKICKTE